MVSRGSETVNIQYRVLSLLRDNGPLSRAQLSDRLEVPRPRLLTELDALVATGRILEAGPAASRGGRRSTLVQLDPGLRFAAVDLGASSIDIEITDGGLEPVASYAEPADIRSGPVAVLDRVSELLHKMRAQGHYTRLDAIGIGLPGPVSFREGVPVSPPIMVGWNRYPVRDTLAREHGCPVVVDNDVNVMAIGEQHSGVARTVDHLLFVKIGSGIGSGMQHHGRIYRGAEGCAGDIGHIQVEADGPVCSCGNTGCLEAYFGGVALARDATEAARSGRSEVLAERLAAQGRLTAVDVAECAAGGDNTCVNLIRAGAPPRRTSPRHPRELHEPVDDRDRRRPFRARLRDALRDPQCRLQALTSPGHREPAHRHVRTRPARRGGRRGAAGQRTLLRRGVGTRAARSRRKLMRGHRGPC